ncbi:hypothetical protein L596_029361 [Steinernema carpocapsae]|uniref:Protein-tyrosine-phosphatase n=1 Tax=Steinernema carpocapsae TaxID=34508 RepID=A0A4U5LUE9_STECR|nr:hypothetical protein L596_029361 [Steinernema carpocapsae]
MLRASIEALMSGRIAHVTVLAEIISKDQLLIYWNLIQPRQNTRTIDSRQDSIASFQRSGAAVCGCSASERLDSASSEGRRIEVGVMSSSTKQAKQMKHDSVEQSSKKKKKRAIQHAEKTGESKESKSTSKSVLQSQRSVAAVTKTKEVTKTERDVYSPETKEKMRGFVEKVTQGGVHALRLQYAELKPFVPPDNAKTASDANPTKCRYKDVGCMDKTRIVLKWPPENKNDFVHANKVTHKLLDNTFICCQGPMDATVPDFWRMIWQERVKLIIMLCRCEELGKEKCAQYWPINKDESKSFFGLSIKAEKIDTSDPSFVQTRLLLTFDKEQRHVDHRQWTKWPDKSVPKTPMAPFRLLQHSRMYTKNPSVVHCSAGIGRTGTLVMIEMVFKALLQSKMPDVMQLTKDLRCQRLQAVQTEDQYVYVHYALMQLIHIKSIVPQHGIRSFCKEYENYLKILNANGGKQLPIDATNPPSLQQVKKDDYADETKIEAESRAKDKMSEKSSYDQSKRIKKNKGGRKLGDLRRTDTDKSKDSKTEKKKDEEVSSAPPYPDVEAKLADFQPVVEPFVSPPAPNASPPAANQFPESVGLDDAHAPPEEPPEAPMIQPSPEPCLAIPPSPSPAWPPVPAGFSATPAEPTPRFQYTPAKTHGPQCRRQEGDRVPALGPTFHQGARVSSRPAATSNSGGEQECRRLGTLF